MPFALLSESEMRNVDKKIRILQIFPEKKFSHQPTATQAESVQAGCRLDFNKLSLKKNPLR
jgi:hypothetical protein